MKKILKSFVGLPIAVMVGMLAYYILYEILGNDELFLNELVLNFPNKYAVLKQIAAIGICGMLAAYSVLSFEDIQNKVNEDKTGWKTTGNFMLKVILPEVFSIEWIGVLSIFTKNVKVILSTVYILGLIIASIAYIIYQQVTVRRMNNKLKEKQENK